MGPSWSWSYGGWIYDYLCNQCLSQQTLWVRLPLSRGVLDTTFCDKVCQWLAAGGWSSLVSSINKTDRRDITEILLKVALNTINLNQTKSNKISTVYWLMQPEYPVKIYDKKYVNTVKTKQITDWYHVYMDVEIITIIYTLAPLLRACSANTIGINHGSTMASPGICIAPAAPLPKFGSLRYSSERLNCWMSDMRASLEWCMIRGNCDNYKNNITVIFIHTYSSCLMLE